jgi:hypothetical protein
MARGNGDVYVSSASLLGAIADRIAHHKHVSLTMPSWLTSVGSPLALKYLRPDWVAPLGSTALIFNFIFARWLVGTRMSTSIRAV